ncbi:MAG: DUF362 domain-containing protein [Deltaproteobacteria bacterium]|nr:DUF362 domain-containing protein [Deltaproteobacteria bacterium]
MPPLDRRSFLRDAAAVAAGLALAPRFAWAQVPAPTGPTLPSIVVVHGTDVARMLAKGIERMGGWGAFVNPGKQATVKPNVGWASRPEQGGNTDPNLVGAMVTALLAAGASEVVVPENPCSPAKQSFPMSGIADAVARAGGRMKALEDGDYRTVSLPGAQELKTADVALDCLETGCLVNVPVAKQHGGARLTLSLKNWMGSVRDRGVWHRGDLHQCIADMSTFLKPSLVVLDATRIMLGKGPRGPGPLAWPHQIVLGRDPVAVDVYAASLFGMTASDVPHLRIAEAMGVGVGDLARVAVEHVHA